MSAKSFKSQLRARIAQRVVSSRGPINRLKAGRFGLDALSGRKPTLELYYEPGDPHSHLAAQLLPKLVDRLKVPVAVRVVGEADAEAYPEAAKQRDFALKDASRIAPAYGLNFPDNACRPTEATIQRANAILVAAKDTADFVARESAIAPAMFGGQPLPDRFTSADDATTQQVMRNNHGRRASLGHYLPGMWQFRGDWFWAVGRMTHLEQSLRQGGWLQGKDPLISLDPAQARLPALPKPVPPLEFYFSFRSPYSYIAAEQMQRHLPELNTELVIRPVLPMAMRGMKIPAAKRLYIPRDVKREADLLGLPFGLIADPIGAGAERCLTVFTLAESLEQQLAFLVEASRAVWSKGVDVATDAGLRDVCLRSGIDWDAASRKLAAGKDLAYAEANRKAMFAAGCWGVPSFTLGEFSTWGQDRMWMVFELLRRSQ